MLAVASALKTLKVSWRHEFKNLSQTESMVFLAIASSPGIESSHIQEELDLDQPHVSRTLNKLIDKQLVRALILKKGDRKKVYFLEPQTGAAKLLGWVDGVVDGLLVANPNVLARFIASLEDAPESVIESIEKGLDRVKVARKTSHAALHRNSSYDQTKRNRSNQSYLKLIGS